MKCLMCERFSLLHICKECQKLHLVPQLYERKILNNIPVYSFYKYSSIESFLHTKHTDLGYYIYNILAQNSFKKFAQNFEFEDKVSSFSIDDKISSGYSHSAILNRALKSKHIQPYYAKLLSQSDYKYSSKSYNERLMHPRDFSFDASCNNVILVDDIITTGLTLTQAVQSVMKSGSEVLFCLTLASVDEK